jgi:ribonuclease III
VLLDALEPVRRRQALAHRSWVRDRVDSYERLELLGDSVLQLLVTNDLLARHPAASEGDVAWMRQQVVAREPCAVVSVESGLPQRMIEGAPARARDDARRVADSDSVQAALCEAVIGAAFLDLGLDATKGPVLAAFDRHLVGAQPGQRDPKTALQELVARQGEVVVYQLVSSDGPPHARVFATRVLLGGNELAAGSGRSKQAAEQDAARAALAVLEVD